MSNLLSPESLTLDSREVAEMLGKKHKNLLSEIRKYDEYLTGSDFSPLDFFIEGNYKDAKGENRPRFQITKKGCELIAHKMTGQKGTRFTATYIDKFHSMENELVARQKDSYTIDDPIERAEAWIREQKEKQQLQLTNKKQEQLIGELKPKADYTDKILKNKGLVTITQIAKDYGMSGQEMNALLHDLGVQYKQSDQWLLYVKYQGKGYTHSQTIDIIRKDGSPGIKMNTKWTQKGRLFLYNLLKSIEILPVIERRN